MIMVALAIFLTLIWVGVGIGKFLIDLGFRKILYTNLLGQGTWYCVAGWLFCCNTITD
jgi:hypothetical protein